MEAVFHQGPDGWMKLSVSGEQQDPTRSSLADSDG